MVFSAVHWFRHTEQITVIRVLEYRMAGAGTSLSLSGQDALALLTVLYLALGLVEFLEVCTKWDNERIRVIG